MVAGCAGMIGARVADLLLRAGHTVIGLDNINELYDVRLKEWRLRQLEPEPRFRFHRVDIAKRDDVAGIFAEIASEGPIAAIVNLAACTGVRFSVLDPWVYYDSNTVGTLNLLDAARTQGIAKFILASTSSLYGAFNPVPYQEDANTDRPLSPYAASKKAAETLCYTYHHLHGLDITVFRFFTVYGPAGRPDMAPFRFVKWISEGTPLTIFGDGRQSRDFTYLDDIADGVIRGLRPLGYEVINLGFGTPIVLADAIEIIERAVGKPALRDYQDRHAADMESTWANTEKARRILGWQPQTGFAQGIERVVDWYRANKAWVREIKT